jgi:hypothetical protein
MRITVYVAMTVLTLYLGTMSLPVAATEYLQPTVMTIDNLNNFTPVVFKSDLNHMKVEEMVAIAVGAAVVGSMADMFFESGIGTIVGVVTGMALGSHWYEEGWFPFSH